MCALVAEIVINVAVDADSDADREKLSSVVLFLFWPDVRVGKPVLYMNMKT
jgi:hypothetical protein